MSIVERFRALPPSGQLATLAGAGLVFAVLLGAGWFAMRPQYDVLFRDLRPADAATIVAELEKDKVPYKLDDGGATILAPAAQVDQIRLEVMGADLPLKGTVGFELFNKSDMGLTEFAQRINYQRALQGELARTIMTIDAIDTARVHLTMPEPSIFRADRRPAKASVTLTTRPGRGLTPEAVAGIQRLVAASVPELDIANVVVLDAQGTLVAGAASVATGSEAGAASAVVQQTRAIEEYYTASLRQALEPLYTGVQVRVLVPLDQWAGADGPAARERSLTRWTPNGRDFRLQVEVSAPTDFVESQRADIAQIVADEIAWAAERGDLLSFAVVDAGAAPGALAEVSPVSARGAASVPAPSGPGPRSDFLMLAGAAAVVIALGGMLVLLRKRRRPSGQLSPEERDAYVRRLKRLLAEDVGHAG